MTKTRIVITVVVSAAVVLGGIAVFGPKKQKTTYDTAKVERGSVVQTVEATGAVDSTADAGLSFETSGRIKRITANVGDAVKAGDVLATLDNGDATSALQRAQAGVLSAQATLDRLLSGATPQDIKVSAAAVASAQSNLDVAQQALTDATQANADAKVSGEASLGAAYASQAGALETLSLKTTSALQTLSLDVYDASGNRYSDVTPSDDTQAQQASASFKEALTASAQLTTNMTALRATSDRTTIDGLSASIIASGDVIRNALEETNTMMQGAIPAGSMTAADLMARQADVKLAWTDVVAAYNAAVNAHQAIATAKAANEASLNVAQAKVNTATQNVKVAQSSLESAQAELDLKTAPATSFDLENARSQLAQARATLSGAQVDLDKTRIVAPFDGTIAQVAGRVGSTVSGADVVMRIHGQEVYEIEADIPETDVAKLKSGMTGTVTLDAYGTDKSFPITLTTIDNAETVIQDIVYYKTRFTLTSPDEPVRAGMTANVKVIAAQQDNVLVIPLRAVHTRDDGSKYVRVLGANDQIQEVTVTLGLRGDENRVEMLTGPSEGDMVILATYVNGKAV